MFTYLLLDALFMESSSTTSDRPQWKEVWPFLVDNSTRTVLK